MKLNPGDDASGDDASADDLSQDDDSFQTGREGNRKFFLIFGMKST